MNTMNTNTMFDCDQYLQIGGSMLDDSSMLWWPDDTIQAMKPVETISTNVNKSAPSDLSVSLSFEPDTFQIDSWMSEGVDLSLLDNLVDFSVIQEQGPQDAKKDFPDSPSSFDSGIASPGPSIMQECEAASPAGSSKSFSSSDGAHDLLYSPPIESPLSSAQELAPGTLDFSGISSLPIASDSEIAFLEALDQSGTNNVLQIVDTNVDTTCIPITTVNFIPSTISIPEVSPKPQPIAPRKSPKIATKNKALTMEEKRERKRAQNKNAATRYREKKRMATQEVVVVQTELQEKNKELKNNVAQIGKEIQYLKDLLIEVYRTKGLIE